MAKTKKKSSIWLNVVLVVLFLVVVVSGIMIIKELLVYTVGDGQYSDIVQDVVVPVARQEGAESDIPTPPIQVDFEKLRAQNPDIVGWIYSEGTVINYPVVQGSDNDYYLTHLFDGSQNKMGSIFMEVKNLTDYSNKNTILYGHNMKNGSMFGSLVEYKAQSYYDQHPELFYATPEGNYHLELYAGYLTEGSATIPIDFSTDEEFMSYAQNIKDKSTFDSGMTLQQEDQLMTLYTCSYEYDDARYVVVGRLIPWEA